MTSRILILSLALSALPVATQAQTLPLQTEQATTAPARTISFETGGAWFTEEPNFQTGQPRDTWAGPLLRVIWSPADPVEMDIEWVVRVGAEKDPTFGSVSDAGDVTLRSKVRFHSEEDGGPTLGGRFTVTLPETSYGEGLGPNTLRMTAQFLIGKTVGRLRVDVNAGLGLFDKVLEAHEQSDFFVYGLGLEQRFTRGFALVGEVAGRTGGGARGTDNRNEVRLGTRLGGGRVRLSAALRHGLSTADGTWGAVAGLDWRVR